MKEKSTSKHTVPWDVTESMFLSEAESDSLIRFLRDTEHQHGTAEKHRALVDRLIIEILMFSGIRNSELCRLSVADTEIEHGKPLLRIVESSSEVREVFLPRSLSREIVQFVRDARHALVSESQSDKGELQVLIPNERGRPYDRTALYRRVVRILTAAGLKDRASVQLLRHTYGYLAYKRSNGNLLFVQQQLGHAHPMVTSVYAQFVNFSYSDLADAVGGNLSATTQSSSTSTNRQSTKRKAKT